jgi:two-component system, OmpR family, sensor histidine kinase KdpD
VILLYQPYYRIMRARGVAPKSLLREALIWSVVLASVAAALHPFRGELDKAHISLILLLVVLGAGARGGRVLGVAIGVASFLVFDWFFLPPYGTLFVANPYDWLVLVAFLATSVVAAQLLHREQESARRALSHAANVDRLATLGAEALNAPRAETALAAVATVIRDSTDSESCAIYVVGDAGTFLGALSPPNPARSTHPPLVEWVAKEASAAAELEDGASRLARPGDPPRSLVHDSGPPLRGLFVPLTVRGETAGVLHLHAGRIASLDEDRWRFLDALAYYAALGADRVRVGAELERAEAVREANKLKDALIISVSHDLRTPLTTIKALAHELGSLGDDRSQVIEEQADRLNHYVANLLDLSRLNAGSMPVHIELNAVDDLIAAAVQETEGRFASRLLDVRLPADGAILAGRFDLALAVRALVNLLENAHKYSPAAARVILEARAEGQRLLISVADEGPGIPPKEAEQIFAPFYRATGQAPDASSAGLGLAIARRMAEAQGGAVTWAPRTPRGSVFTLALPIEDLTSATTAAGIFTKP